MAKKKTAKAKLNAYNPRKILDLVIPGQSSVQTIGEFFMECLDLLWDEGETFSGKRPQGNSDWEIPLYQALVAGRYIPGTIEMADDGDGGEYVLDAVYDAVVAHKLIARVLSDSFLKAEVVK